MTAISIERNTEKFKNLPLDYQEAIKTSDYDNALSLVAKEYKLHIDQSALLEVLLAKMIFGEVESEEMVSEIKNKIYLTNDEAIKIAGAINELVINPIKENLKKLQSKTDTKEDLN